MLLSSRIESILMQVMAPVVGQTEEQVVVHHHLGQKDRSHIGLLALTPFENFSFLLARSGAFSTFVNWPPAFEHDRGEFR